ncbi:glycosyltransferase family 4 protein [Vibrio alfacsensis]|uniref:glycosyltransferase family 4 protein n=1 Tax=Vibrio alfacsensis TaxID=1074311 RepID=UPI0040695EE8
MTVLAYLSEPFKYAEQDGKYISNKASLMFIEDCFEEQVICVGRLVEDKIDNPSVSVDQSLFEEIPNYISIIDFVKKSVLTPTFLYRYVKRCSELIDTHPDSKVWVRNPSIGCLIFSLFALRKKRKIYNHMCANAMEAWDNPKYRGMTRVCAYIFSRLLKYLAIKVVKHPLTTNLCTGDELLNICKSYNSNSYLLIDSSISFTSSSSYVKRIPDDSFKFTFVGRVQEDKGVIDLIEAFARLDNKKFKLDIIGSGNLLGKLSKENSNPNIRFLGQVENKKIRNYLSSSDIVVVPSKNRYEGFPRVILEAWSCGVPVITSNVGGVNAFVFHGENGLIVPPDNISSLYSAMIYSSNPNVYKVLSENSNKMRHMTTREYWVEQFKGIANE